MDSLSAPRLHDDETAALPGNEERGDYSYLLPVAIIGLVISFVLFWLTQLFGQWYVGNQLSETTRGLLRPTQEHVQDQLGMLPHMQSLLSRSGEGAREKVEDLFGTRSSQTPYLSFFIVSGTETIPVGGGALKENIPATREDWNRRLAAAEVMDATTLALKDEKTGSALLVFSTFPLSTQGKALQGAQALAVLDVTKFLADMRLYIRDTQLDELALYAPSGKTLLGAVTSPQHAGGLAPLIRSDIPLYISKSVFLMRFGAEPERFVLWAIILPYLALLAGLFLTFLVGANLWGTQQRGMEVNALAQSLTKTVSELEQRIVEGELMAAALRESERKYRAIFENASIGICQISPRNEWINANRTLAVLLGFRDVIELLAAQPDLHGRLFVRREEREKWIGDMAQNGQVRDFEAALRRRDGVEIWVAINSHLVRGEQGQMLHYEATFADVTQRRRSEMALLAAKEQADYANRSKSEFLANMSHELRTPLNAIIGFSEIIKDELFGKVGNPQYVEYAKDIYDSGELLLSLINDILDMSKIEAGKRELSESVINVSRTVQACLRLVAARAKMSKQHLNVDLPRDFPDLRGEERAFKQVLVNLMTNAIKFTPENGTITVHGHMDGEGRMHIVVEDTGIGIAPEHIPVVLAPFGQIESALSRKNQGTGLGLPLTKALVELHDGELHIDSTVGKGTTVTITLPASRVLQQTL